ncbi:MAG: hypothetical protein Q8L36_00765 [bacterium]|nr:hypothetical protein [bacterium]
MKKNFLIVIALVLVVLLGFLIWSEQLRPSTDQVPAEQNNLEVEGLSENPAQDLEGIDLEGLENEFNSIDTDLENL